MLFSLAVSVSAASLVSFGSTEINLKTTKEYGYEKYEFLVNASSTGTAKIKYDCGSKVKFSDGNKAINTYGYYEIRVWGNTGSGWKELTAYKKNLMNSQNGTIEMKDYKQYKVRVYSWKTETIANTVGGFSSPSKAGWHYMDIYRSYPTIKLTASTRVKSFAKTSFTPL